MFPCLHHRRVFHTNTHVAVDLFQIFPYFCLVTVSDGLHYFHSLRRPRSHFYAFGNDLSIWCHTAPALYNPIGATNDHILIFPDAIHDLKLHRFWNNSFLKISENAVRYPVGTRSLQ